MNYTNYVCDVFQVVLRGAVYLLKQKFVPLTKYRLKNQKIILNLTRKPLLKLLKNFNWRSALWSIFLRQKFSEVCSVWQRGGAVLHCSRQTQWECCISHTFRMRRIKFVSQFLRNIQFKTICLQEITDLWRKKKIISHKLVRSCELKNSCKLYIYW